MKRISMSQRWLLYGLGALVALAAVPIFIHIRHARINQGLIDATEQANLTSMRLLLDHGADPDTPVTDKLTKPTAATYFKNALHGPLHNPRAPRATPLMLAVIAGRPDMAQLLLDRGARVDARDEYGFTALSMAVSLKRPDLVKLLLAHGADPNATNALKMPPLAWALMLDRTESACALLDRGADPDASDYDGRPALYLAAIEENTRAVQALLAHGADANASFLGCSVLQLAAAQGDAEIIRALQQHGARSPVQFKATIKLVNQEIGKLGN